MNSKLELLRRIKELDREGQAFLDTIPLSLYYIKEAIFDNDYVGTTERKANACLEYVFGDYYEDVCWFLYEWSPEGCNTIWVKEKEYRILTEEDYYTYFEQECK